jgi:hypothetical protein
MYEVSHQMTISVYVFVFKMIFFLFQKGNAKWNFISKCVGIVGMEKIRNIGIYIQTSSRLWLSPSPCYIVGNEQQIKPKHVHEAKGSVQVAELHVHDCKGSINISCKLNSLQFYYLFLITFISSRNCKHIQFYSKWILLSDFDDALPPHRF